MTFARLVVLVVSIHTAFGVEYRYVVDVPREFERARKWPVVLALHGGGEYGSDGIRQTAGAIANVIRRNRAEDTVGARRPRCAPCEWYMSLNSSNAARRRVDPTG